MNDGSPEKIDKSADEDVGAKWDDVSEVEFAGAGDNEPPKYHLEVLKNSLRNIFGENDDCNKLISDLESAILKEEETGNEQPADDEVSPNDTLEQDTGRYGWKAFVKGTKEGDELQKDESLFMFLTSADGGYAVKKDDAVGAFIEKVESADNSKEFEDAKMLALAIQNNKAEFDGSEVKRMTDYMQSPTYQKKLFNYYIERSKKAIEKRSEDLKRCLDEVEEEKKKNGALSKVFNRGAIKQAEKRADWTKKGIEEAEKSLMYYSEKLKELEDGGTGISAEQLAQRFIPENEKAA